MRGAVLLKILADGRCQVGSLEAATRWFAAVSESSEASGAEVRLLVAAAQPGGGELEVENAVDAAAEWAADNAFEFVALLPSCSSAAGADSREKLGLARVREALEAHTWPGLEPKATLPRAAAAPQPPPPSAALDEEDDAYEALMGAMRQARDAASAGTVPDEERRARAAELAMQMAALLGFDDDEEAGDYEEALGPPGLTPL